MHRTQVLLVDWQYEALSRLAREQKTSLASVMRDMLSKQLDGPEQQEDDPLLALKGIHDGPESERGRDYKALMNE